MGRFYTNYTINTRDRAAVERVAREVGRPTLVSPVADSHVVLFDGDTDSHDTETLHRITAHYADALKCAVWGVLNHDDSVLMYALYVGDDFRDEYISDPDYFGVTEDDGTPIGQGGDAAILAGAFNRADAVPAVEQALRLKMGEASGVVFETERHGRLVAALSLDAVAVGRGYDELLEGDYPDGVSASAFLEIGD